MDENTRAIVEACKQVVQSADDYDSEVMTTPITVLQAICQLDCVLDKVRKMKIVESATGANEAP